MKNKSEQVTKFKTLDAFYKKQLGVGIRRVRDDKGGEYTAAAYLQYLEQEGIRHEKTAPASPQQNGIAERLNRSLDEGITCMFEEAKRMLERENLPISF
jgi:transposase InsO family protein